MASKFWFVEKKTSLSNSEEFRLSTLSTSSTIIPRSQNPGYLEELNVIEPYQDFQIEHNKKREFCSWDKYYEISTGRDKILFIGIQNNSLFCCLNDPYEKIELIGVNSNKHVLKIQKIHFSGYITTKMHFAVSSGTKLGEVIKISNFLEAPKYEINDVRGDFLFSLSVGPMNNNSTHQDFHVLGKAGKTAHIQEEDGVFRMKIYQLCSVIEKTMLLSLVLLMDLAIRAG